MRPGRWCSARLRRPTSWSTWRSGFVNIRLFLARVACTALEETLEDVFLRLTGRRPANERQSWRAVAAQTRMELALSVRRGENVLVTVIIPVILLVFFRSTGLGPGHGRKPHWTIWCLASCRSRSFRPEWSTSASRPPTSDIMVFSSDWADPRSPVGDCSSRRRLPFWRSRSFR